MPLLLGAFSGLLSAQLRLGMTDPLRWLAGGPIARSLFDHRNASLQQWLVDDYIGGAEGIGNKDVAGIFLDDTWTPQGPTEEDDRAVKDTGLGRNDVSDMMVAYGENLRAVQKSVIDSGAMNWQLMNNSAPLSGPPFGPGESCTRFMREVACVDNSTLEDAPLFFGFERNSDYPPVRHACASSSLLAL